MAGCGRGCARGWGPAAALARSLFGALSVVLAVGLVSGVGAPLTAMGSPWGPSWRIARRAQPAPRPEDPAEAEALLAQADVARTEARWADAARLFTAAYDALPEALLPSLGEMTVRFAIESGRRLADDTRDAAPLHAARDLAARFEAELGALPEPQDLPASIARLQGELDTDPRLAETASEPSDAGPPPAPAVDSPPAPPHRPSTTVSWALVGVGAGAVVAGIATLVWGSRILPIATERLDMRGPDLRDPAADDDYLALNRRRGRIVIGVGAGIAVAGVPLLVWGVLRLVSARRGAGSEAVVPRRRDLARRGAPLSGPGWSSR